VRDGDGVLVRRTKAHGGGGDGNRAVVSRGLATSGAALGAHSGSAGKNLWLRPSSPRLRPSLPPRSSSGLFSEGRVEVTFHEVRSHLGVETQRQWSDLAILHITPALLGLFSLVTLFAHQLLGEQAFPVRQASWYAKALPTFSDTLAFVRKQLWPVTLFSLLPAKPDMVEIPRTLAFAD
jgi:hypothetical protein